MPRACWPRRSQMDRPNPPPWRYAFDAASTPYAARNALGLLLQPETTVAFAGLPAHPALGQRAFITDATVSTFGAIVSVGGGTNKLPIFFDGTNWKVG
jgi:hypothetical protein